MEEQQNNNLTGDDFFGQQTRSEANTLILNYLKSSFRQHTDLIAKFEEVIGDQFNSNDIPLKVQNIFNSLSQLNSTLMNPFPIDQVNTIIGQLEEIISGLSEETFKSIFQFSNFGKSRFEKKLNKWKKKISRSQPNDRKDALEGLLNNVEKLVFCIPDRLLNIVNNQLNESSTILNQAHEENTELTPLGSVSEIHPLDEHESFISENDPVIQTIQQESSIEVTHNTSSTTSIVLKKKRLRQTKLFDLTPHKEPKNSVSTTASLIKVKNEFEPIRSDCTLQGLNKFRKTSEYYSENKYSDFITDRVNGITTHVETEDEDEEDEESTIKVEKTEPRTRSQRRRSQNTSILSSSSAARSLLSSPTKKPSSRFWSAEEIEKLEEGYRRFGDNWTRILKAYSTTFHTCRTPAALQDRFLRILAPKFKREEEESFEDSDDSDDNDPCSDD